MEAEISNVIFIYKYIVMFNNKIPLYFYVYSSNAFLYYRF